MARNVGFNRLMKHLAPYHKVPSRTYFSDKIVPDIYERMKSKISDKLIELTNLSLTSDIWTSSHNNECFISVSGHWIDQSWSRNSFVLSCSTFKRSHTGVNIATKIENLLQFWNIDKSKVHLIRRDNAANIIKGCKEANIEHEGCFIHSLQLVINKSLQTQNDVLDMITAARKIVTHFSHSPQACEKLEKLQSDLSMPHKKLVQDVVTR